MTAPLRTVDLFSRRDCLLSAILGACMSWYSLDVALAWWLSLLLSVYFAVFAIYFLIAAIGAGRAR